MQIVARSALAALGCWLAACGDGGDPGPRPDYFPLAVGNRWVYAETVGTSEGTTTKTLTGTETYDGRETIVQETVETITLVRKRHNLLDAGDRIDRLRQQRWLDDRLLDSRTYDPGFPRILLDLTEPGQSSVEDHVRHELDGAGNEVQTEAKSYTYLVEAAGEEVTVPAGTFSCLVIRRTDADDGDTTLYYWAEGVGKVKEEGDGEIEELIEYELAE